MVELRQYKHILALAKYRNFRNAAESVFISQPALSLSLKAAETELGQKLFFRTNKTVTPTVFGEIVIEMAEKLLVDLENMQREIDLLAGIDQGFLKISLSPYINYSIGDRLIKVFMGKYPKISLDLVYSLWDDRVHMLEDKQIDLVVEAYRGSHDKKHNKNSEISITEVQIPGIVYFCRAGHPLASKKKVSCKEITMFDWAGEGGPPAYLKWLAAATGLTSAKEIPDRRLKLLSTDYYSILTAVLNSDKISAGSPVFFNKYEKKGTIKYLDIDWKIPHIENKGSIILLKNRKDTPILQDTVAMIREIFSDLIREGF